VYSAPDADLSATVTAELLPGAHAVIRPSAVAKMNLLPAKSEVLLKTCPVGDPSMLLS